MALLRNASPKERERLLTAAQEKSLAVNAHRNRHQDLRDKLNAALLSVGNLVEPGVPSGGEDDFVVLDTVGQLRDFAAEGFNPRHHFDLAKRRSPASDFWLKRLFKGCLPRLTASARTGSSKKRSRRPRSPPHLHHVQPQCPDQLALHPRGQPGRHQNDDRVTCEPTAREPPNPSAAPTVQISTRSEIVNSRGFHGGRIDSLGVDENGTPVIVECKRGIDADLLTELLAGF